MSEAFSFFFFAGLFNRSRAFRRAWDFGSRALGEGAFSEETRPRWWQRRFEMAPKWLQNGANMAAKWALEASWRPLGALKKTPGRQRGGFQGLLGRSWTPLSTLSGPPKVVLNGSWPLQEEFQDRFQPSWGPKSPTSETKRAQSRVQEATWVQHTVSSKTVDFQWI